MARYHVNRLSRFSSPDLLAGSIADPQSLNRYAYVANDPTNLADPLGLAMTQTMDGAQGWSRVPIYDPWQIVGYMETMFGFRSPWAVEGYNVPIFCWMTGSSCIVGYSYQFTSSAAGGDKKKRDVINAALKQKNLAKCLNKWIGPGTILTNDNLPHIDASKDLPGAIAGQTDPNRVPETGHGTVEIDRGLFNGLPANDLFLVGTYLHETANVLAIQTFTNVQPRGARALRGMRGGPPAEGQKNHPWDRDIGEQFEECLHGKD